MKKIIPLKFLFAMLLMSSNLALAIGDDYIPVSQRKYPSQVSVGYKHFCALVGKAVTCWGENSKGQLNVPALKNARQIATGFYHSCALDEEGVKCWGSNDYGQINVPALKNPTQVSAGGHNACAIDADGVKCWGEATHEKNKVPPLVNPFQVSVGAETSCALDAQGVKCWGSEFGTDKYNLLKPPPLNKPIQVSANNQHICALDSGGVKCWGRNDYHQTEVPVLKNPYLVKTYSLGTCAFDDDGKNCWGNFKHESVCQFETNGVKCSMDQMPLAVPANLRAQKPILPPVQVSVGDGHKCVLDIQGVHCWGGNDYGQINVPILKNPRAVSVGLNHTCALDTDGVKCWGLNNEGQTSVPPLKNPTQVTAGIDFTCALDAEGVKCWGRRLDSNPTVVGLLNPLQVTAGKETLSCAVDFYGIKCWDWNNRVAIGANIRTITTINPTNISVGNIGDSTEVCFIDTGELSCTHPVNTTGLKSPRLVSVGNDENYVIDGDGLKIWSRSNPQPTLAPTQVGALIQVSTGSKSSDEACWVGLKGMGCRNSTVFPQNLKFYVDLKYLRGNFTPVRALWAEGLSLIDTPVDSLDDVKKLWFQLALSSLPIRSGDSAVFVEKLIPEYEKTLEVLGEIAGYLSFDDGLGKVPDDIDTRRMALTSIHGVLRVLLEYQALGNYDVTQEAIRLVGVSLADPMNNQNLSKLLKQLQQMTKEKNLLSQSPKVRFFVPTLEMATGWLEGLL